MATTSRPGIFLLAIGLAKKVFLADPLVPLVSAGFDHATTIGTLQAWLSALAYTLQIYFDFSGYTDMALGAALIFNIRLPINFDSPYRSLDLRDFWHRWHMTLSRFLREYVYVPLGGNRAAESRVLANLLLTFLLGGLWHGAAWTFVCWGALHGLGLCAVRLWRGTGRTLPRAGGWALTFLFVVVTWVFFRAHSLGDAWAIVRAMAGLSSSGGLGERPCTRRRQRGRSVRAGSGDARRVPAQQFECTRTVVRGLVDDGRGGGCRADARRASARARSRRSSTSTSSVLLQHSPCIDTMIVRATDVPAALEPPVPDRRGRSTGADGVPRSSRRPVLRWRRLARSMPPSTRSSNIALPHRMRRGSTRSIIAGSIRASPSTPLTRRR